MVQGAEVALNLLDAGLLTHAGLDLTPSMMVKQSMGDWFAGITLDLNWFEANLFMTNDHEYLHHGLDPDSMKKQFDVAEDQEKVLHFGISFGTWYWFTLKEKVEALEAKVEGLGETAIWWLDKHVQRLCTAITPNFCLYGAQYAYWYGEDNESVFIEENGGEADDIYTRAEFDASFPKLAYEAGEKLDRDALTALLSHSDREVAALAAMLLEPEIEDGVGGAYLQEFADDHLPIIEPAICLAWSEGDDSVRIADDYMNMEGEHGNVTDYHAVWTVENSSDGLLKAKRCIERYVSELKKIEDVLSLVATCNANI